MMVADAAEEESPKSVPPPLRLVMCALPALVSALKMVPASLLSMMALAAVLVSVPPGVPNRVTLPLRFEMVALPALLASAKKVVPVCSLTRFAVPAALVPKNAVEPPSVVIEVMPEVLPLTTVKSPSLVMAPTILPVWVASPTCSAPPEEILVPPL